jgi:prolyl-tRNA editing enzyme YbaK/EbsC (Cys-tRNA(Pro) deacylase)
MLPRPVGVTRAGSASGPNVACYPPAVPETVPHSGIQRVLEAAARKGVTLDIHVFDESTHTAEEAAAAVGAEIGQIVKSLVFVAPGDGGGLEPILCLISGPNRVDLARLAAVTGVGDVRRATAREANELTGFTIGGIPPIGHLRPMRVIMDPDLGRFQVVWAAAGTATAVFPVPPATLRTLANAVVMPVTEDRATMETAPSGGRGGPGGFASTGPSPQNAGA